MSVPGFEDLRQARHIFEDVAVFSIVSQNLTGGGEPARLAVARASQSFLPVLGIRVATVAGSPSTKMHRIRIRWSS
jgi:hypothetical protein